MTYQVLARKWRPRRFSEVVGQDHVIKTLVNAIEHDRTHHAYLFTGTRGVGKTTIARILAKALNCKSRNGADPCAECPICLDVDSGRFVDLIEVDAASRTKVEDTRDLLENVQYAPAWSGYKVYLIDEVHMLSGHSFNALLKTLEEPPPHVKFLLATTDPQKIPVTVLSRCLQLNLKRLLPEQIRSQMRKILSAENIEFEEKALIALARSADGSMRDGLSLLDQAIAHGAGRVEGHFVEKMLGIVSESPLCDILMNLANNNAEALLESVNHLADLTQDFSEVLRQLLGQLHRIALIQITPKSVSLDDASDQLGAVAENISPADIQLFYQIGLIGQRDLDLAPDPRSGFEMVLLRMLAFKPAGLTTGNDDASSVESDDTDQGDKRQLKTTTKVAPSAIPGDISDKSGDQKWQQIVQSMAINGMAKELAYNCSLGEVDDTQLTLILDPDHRNLRSDLIEERLEKALRSYYKKPIKLIIKIGELGIATPAIQAMNERKAKQAAAELAIENDENIRALAETFDGKVIPGSTVPRNTE